MNDFLPGLFGIGGVVLGTLIPFLFVLTVVVFVHEMGHYLIGRFCGIGVRAFSVGFGPELVGFTDRHGTRWKLCAIPLGGYVKFVGDMNATSSQPGSEEIEKLTDAISSASDAASQIRVMAQQQVTGVTQIAQAMHSINQATTQTVEGTRQIERAARDLNELSLKLRDAVAHYRI